MIEITNCPICGATSFKEVYNAPYFRGDNSTFAIKECNNCQFWFTSPRPADDKLGSYYDVEDYVSHTDNKKGLVDNLYHFVREIATRNKVRLIDGLGKDGKKLLDYGAGTGYFLAKAKDTGWQVEGVEPSEEARKVAQEKHQLSLTPPDEFVWKENSYSRITMWHVLEHLPNLQLMMKSLAGALQAGGFLIIAVPNHESYDSKRYKENWAALDVPLHLYHFKKKNIEELANMHGLKLKEIKNMPFDSFYVSMLSEKIKTGKNNFLRAAWIGLLSNLKGNSNKNASSLIYVLEKPI